MNTLSVKECLTFGWNTFKSRPWIFVQAGLLLFLVNLGVNLLQTIIEKGGELAGEPAFILAIIVSMLVGIGVSFLVSMGETAFFLRAHTETNAVELKDLWHPHPFWKFAAAIMLAGIAILIGFILLIIPGIILGILFAFVGYLVIDKGLGPIEAIKESVRITKGNRLQIFLLGLALFGINLLGLIALIVGLLVTVPVSFLAMVHAYRTLTGSVVAAVEEPVEETVVPAAV